MQHMNPTTEDYDNAIAIIGAFGEFPGSENLNLFWQHLTEGKELITFFSEEELVQEGIDSALIRSPNYVKAKGYLSDSECFDASFFGYSAREAELIDPQQRRLLQWAWSALEVAGYDAEQYEGSIGVFACSSLSSYLYLNLLPTFSMLQKMQDEMLMVMGNEKDFIATRISYKMNLKGPSKSIQTACSSSLVAVHDACQSLLNHECDIALAGGVSITFPQKSGYLYSKEGITSIDGHCRAFDHLATGTLTGNGGGMVVLKRLQEAIQERDNIIALIRGSCINNDGADKIGYTAPSIKGQANAIIGAHLSAQVDPTTIQYIECHGTGTILGDPIEIRALTAAFEAQSTSLRKQFCALGSVKTNIGHLDAAAGIAGLIKTAWALQNKLIPPSLNFEKGNPKIPFEESPFYVNNQLLPWISEDHPRRAGVSSFGMGGTNAHAVLEEPPTRSKLSAQYETYLFPFSAKSQANLKLLLCRFLAFLDHTPHIFADIMYTLQVGRHSFEYRVCFICHSKDELKEGISHYLKHEVQPDISKDSIWTEAALLWQQGATIAWKGYYTHEKRCRVPLPTYPFSKNKYFVFPRPHLADKQPHINSSTESSLNAFYKLEERLKRIWKHSLKMDEINMNDNFFNLGGDSLIALEITDNIRNELRVDVDLQSIFDHPTVSALAHLIKQEIGKKAESLSEEESTFYLELL